MEALDNLVMLNEEPLYNVDFICRRPHSKSNTKAAVSTFNVNSRYLYKSNEAMKDKSFSCSF